MNNIICRDVNGTLKQCPYRVIGDLQTCLGDKCAGFLDQDDGSAICLRLTGMVNDQTNFEQFCTTKKITKAEFEQLQRTMFCRCKKCGNHFAFRFDDRKRDEIEGEFVFYIFECLDCGSEIKAIL